LRQGRSDDEEEAERYVSHAIRASGRSIVDH
jgi:hypothetical protein